MTFEFYVHMDKKPPPDHVLRQTTLVPIRFVDSFESHSLNYTYVSYLVNPFIFLSEFVCVTLQDNLILLGWNTGWREQIMKFVLYSKPILRHTYYNNKVRELIAVKLLHTSLLNTTVVASKLLPLGSYAPMSEPIPHFKTILEMILWNGLQSCRCISPHVINVIKMPSFQYFLYLREQKKVTGG